MTDIGKTLQNARNEKHYTLDDLQQITKIQKRYLIAIEENNFDALPGDFYVRAFIRQYADTVGIKADKLLSELDEQAGKKKVEETEEEPESQIVRRKTIELRPMDEEEAILQMELVDHDFFIFKNIDTESVSVLYKRKDGSYGIINT